MVSTEASQTSSESMADPDSTSPRISFSADFLDEADFISISPNASEDKESAVDKNGGGKVEREVLKNVADFEFLSSKILNGQNTMLTADELFFEGKFLPYWQIQHAAERLGQINLKSTNSEDHETDKNNKNNNNNNNNNSSNGDEKKKNGIVLDQQPTMMNKMEQPRIWYIDDDPSPRPPSCTVLWKELLRLRKRRPPTDSSSLTPSSSSSSTSSSSSSMGDQAAAMTEEGKEEETISMKEKHLRRIKKGLERTRSATMRIRPMVNVPVCTQAKGGSMPPLFPLKKGR